jgi:hypothetical protein
VKQELLGGITQGETVQLHNSLGVLTLYQGLRLNAQLKPFENEKNQFYAVPQKSLIKSTVYTISKRISSTVYAIRTTLAISWAMSCCCWTALVNSSSTWTTRNFDINVVSSNQ